MTHAPDAPPQDDAAPRKTFEGAILGVRDDRLFGWAWSPEAPHAPLTIDLYLADWLVATTTADRFDPELLRRGVGEGFHAFVTPLERRPGGDGPFSLQMYAHDSAETIGAPYVVQTKRQLDDLLIRRRLEGRVEGVRDGALVGWAADLYSPGSEPALAFEFDGRPLPRGAPLKRDDQVVHEGGLITAWRFSVELPAAALDGRVHAIAARVGGNVELAGSPLTFGPGAGHGYAQALAALTADVARLERRVAPLPHHHDSAGLIGALGGQILERVDNLLSIYRDQIEQELHVMRAALASIAQGAAGAGPVLPVVAAPTPPADQPEPASTLDFGRQTPRLERGVVDIRADADGDRRGVISGRVDIPLGRRVRPANLVVVEGAGARSAQALLGWRFAAGGRPLLGRYQAWADGAWRFVGALAPHSADMERLDLLTVEPCGDYIEPSWAQPSVEIRRIDIRNGVAAPLQRGREAPDSVAEHLAGAIVGAGWHDAQEDAHGWARWASADSRIKADLEPGCVCAVTVIGADAIPGALDAFYLKVDDDTLPVALRRVERPGVAWIAEATAPAPSGSGEVWAQLGASGGAARSAVEDGRGDDARVLSVCARAIVWRRVGEARRSGKKKSFWRWGG